MNYFRQRETLHLLKNKQWRERSGKIINISDMSQSHIAQCIRIIKEKEWRLEWLPLLEEEYEKRRQEVYGK